MFFLFLYPLFDLKGCLQDGKAAKKGKSICYPLMSIHAFAFLFRG